MRHEQKLGVSHFIINYLSSVDWYQTHEALRLVIINEPVSELFCILSRWEVLSLTSFSDQLLTGMNSTTGKHSSSQPKQSGHSFTSQRHPDVNKTIISSGLKIFGDGHI